MNNNLVKDLKKITKDTTSYKIIVWFLYPCILGALLGLLIYGVPKEQLYILWQFAPSVSALFFLAYNCLDYYTKILILVEDSGFGELLSLILTLSYLACSIFIFRIPEYWVIITGIAILVISIKNLQMHLRLKLARKKLNLERRHPLEESFRKWAIISFGYALVAILTGIIISFNLTSTIPPFKMNITNIISAGIISYLSIKNKIIFTRKRIESIETEVENYLSWRKSLGINE